MPSPDTSSFNARCLNWWILSSGLQVPPAIVYPIVVVEKKAVVNVYLKQGKEREGKS